MSRLDAFEEGADEVDAIILEESRRVLDHQIANINAVEDKAAWTLRIGVVLLGTLISAVQLIGLMDVGALVLVGLAFISFSLVVGIITYGVSSVDVGAEPRNVKREVPDDYARSDVYDALLSAHEDSITFNRDTLQTNEWYLTLTQGCMVTGVSLIVAGILGSA